MSLPILDVAIGISFVYLLLALICTTINESLAGWMKTRARFLGQGIARLLGNNAPLKAELYQHPLIQSLETTGKGPSYIPADKFATALMDVLAGKGKSGKDLAAVRTGAETQGDQTKAVVNALLDHAGPDADTDAARAAIEKWFNDGMDRVSGWYKRHAQAFSLIVACLVTLVLNADTLHIADLLWSSPTIRAAVVEEAKVRSEKARPEELLPLVEYPNAQDPTESKPINVPGQALSGKEQALLGQLTGWADDRRLWHDKWNQNGLVTGSLIWAATMLWRHGIGWILTALAVSIGAPFWFDMLNRFMNIRNAGRAPDERKDKSSPAKNDLLIARVPG